MAKVFVTRPIPENGTRMLIDAFGADQVVVSPQDAAIDRADLLKNVRGVEALLPMLTEAIDEELLDAAGPSLKIVANLAVGFNNIDVAAATRHGVAVANTPGVLTETTADLAWTLLMAGARRIGESGRYLRAGRWIGWGPNQFLGVDIHGKNLGIFGMGRIGQALAQRARGFDMTVLYTDAQRLPEDCEAELRAQYVDKATLLAQSDFVSIHCPLLAETRHAFSTAEFAAMKPTAVLVNTARGPIVDEAALAAALKSGRIFAAGIDVFEEEPTVHPDLLACENAVIIPHLGSATRETRAKMAEIAASNIVARLTGKTPPTCLNPEVL